MPLTMQRQEKFAYVQLNIICETKKSAFSLDMICHIRFFEFCVAVVQDCGGNLMPRKVA